MNPKTSHILARWRAGPLPSPTPYLLEVYHNGYPVGFVSLYVHIVFDIIQMALLLDAPIHLDRHNPPEKNKAVREYAASFKVEVQEPQ